MNSAESAECEVTKEGKEEVLNEVRDSQREIRIDNDIKTNFL